MIKIKSFEDTIIVRLIKQESKIGIIELPESSLEKATLAEVMIPNDVSYWRNGEKRDTPIKQGMKVRLYKRCGTEMPESPEGEEWLAIKEDDICYIVEDVRNG